MAIENYVSVEVMSLAGFDEYNPTFISSSPSGSFVFVYASPLERTDEVLVLAELFEESTYSKSLHHKFFMGVLIDKDLEREEVAVRNLDTILKRKYHVSGKSLERRLEEIITRVAP